MRKLLNSPLFVAILVLAALTAAGRSLLPSGKSGLGASPGANLIPKPAGAAADPALVRQARVAAEASLRRAEAGRDPFAPRERVSKEPDVVDTFRLSALWTQNGTTLALVNDQILRTGDVIGRIKIDSASDEGVWVSHWKGRDFISLGQTWTLRTPARIAAARPL